MHHGEEGSPEEGNRGRGCPEPPVVARRRGAGGAARPSSRRRQRPPPRASDGRANARARERERDPRTTRASESDERERNGKTPAQEKPRVRDERQSRPSTLKEMNAQRGYSPYKCIYNRSDGTQCEWNIACYLSCEDLGIICSLFIVLWACLLGIYTLLLKAALDTDEKDTALWIFFAFGVLFTMFVAGAVGMNQVGRRGKRTTRRRTLRLRGGGVKGLHVALDDVAARMVAPSGMTPAPPHHSPRSSRVAGWAASSCTRIVAP